MKVVEIEGKKFNICPKCDGSGNYQRPIKNNRLFGETVGCDKCNRKGVIEIKDKNNK